MKNLSDMVFNNFRSRGVNGYDTGRVEPFSHPYPLRIDLTHTLPIPVKIFLTLPYPYPLRLAGNKMVVSE